ncbi:MAG: TIGR03545 family protein [Colwellia sp.]
MNKDVTATKSRTGLTKFIRLRGLISFFSLILMIVLFVYLLAESLVRIGLKSSLETAFGAEVNVESVELNYSPLILTVNGLQVTDAENPQRNIFSFKTAVAGVDVWQYLLGKTVIETLSVSDLLLAGVRENEGEVFSNQQTPANLEADIVDENDASLPAMNLSLPDVQSILDNTDLLTIKASMQLTDSYKQEKANLLKIKANLPNKDKLDSYEQRVKALGKMKVKSIEDFNLVKTKFEQLRSEFKKEQQQVKSANTLVKQARARLEKDLGSLQQAPRKDWQAIEKKYQLDNVSNDDFAHILFGEQVRGYYQTAEKAYFKISPLLKKYSQNRKAEQEELARKDKIEGRFVYFEEERALPPFLIKTLDISVLMNQVNGVKPLFNIDITELTHQHFYRDLATKINIKSSVVESGSVVANTQFYLDQAETVIASGEWQATNLTLGAIEISKNENLELQLTSGMLSGKGNFAISESKALSGKNNVSIEQAIYDGNASSKFGNIILDTFNDLDRLTIGLNLKGTLNDPEFSITSSLNSAIKGAFKKQIARQLSKFKQEVNKGLNDKVSQSLNLNKEDKQSLIDIETLVTDTDKALEQLKNSDVVKQQKKKLEDKAADKIKDKLKGLFGN